MKVVEFKQVSEKPLCFDVFCDGQYKGLLHYSWTNNGLSKAWLLEMDDRQLVFASKKAVRRYLERLPV